MEGSSKYSKILLDLTELRQTDYDEFMNRLYEALTGEFKDVIHDNAPLTEKIKAIETMITHFKEYEEYEKCADLKKLLDYLHSKSNETISVK